MEISWSPDGTGMQSVEAGTGAYTATGLASVMEYTFTVTILDGDENVTAELTATGGSFACSVSSMPATLTGLNNGVQQTAVTLDGASWLSSNK